MDKACMELWLHNISFSYSYIENIDTVWTLKPGIFCIYIYMKHKCMFVYFKYIYMNVFIYIFHIHMFSYTITSKRLWHLSSSFTTIYIFVPLYFHIYIFLIPVIYMRVRTHKIIVDNIISLKWTFSDYSCSHIWNQYNVSKLSFFPWYRHTKKIHLCAE